MPLYQLLTDRTLAQSSAITPTTLIHIVTTGDTSQNSAGSSYKAQLGQLVGLFSGASDTLVTGGTYSAGTITFTNNSGGTFDVTGLTETFSGGSGNCIADLYVTNIHGCSPITIYDSIRSTGTTVSGLTSFSFGFETSATTDYSFAIGYQTLSSNIASNAEGVNTVASNTASHAEGLNTIASGYGSHAEGASTESSGLYSHAEGGGGLATNLYSHAEGRNTQALGQFSHAEGDATISRNTGSHSEGRNTDAKGEYSHTEGFGTIADGNYQHVMGIYNATGNTTEGAFIIGNGTSDLNRSNLLFAANSGVTVYGNFTANTVSATTYYNLPPKEIFYKSSGPNSDMFGFFYEPFCDGGTDPVYVNGIIPNDFSTMVSCDLITIPKFSGNVLTDIKISYGQVGTIFSGNNISTNITYTYEIDEFTNLNVLPVFSSVTVNDIFSLNVFQSDTRLYVLGLKMKYNRI